MKSPRFLKFIITYKAVVGAVQLFFSIAFLKSLDTSDVGGSLNRFASGFSINIEHNFIHGAITYASMMNSTVVLGVVLVFVLFGVINLIEAYGLHLKQRWAEWLTVIATALLIPVELYEVMRAFSILMLMLLAINSAVVYYLAKHKELFKPRRARA